MICNFKRIEATVVKEGGFYEEDISSYAYSSVNGMRFGDKAFGRVV
ncbi:hypothetical protein GCM10011389_30370 [Pontibacillus salipaludis]|uniref:Uncharacterized protein n=1 Tax=Pontibacillus salipaludis TaxID=1697394 RepID=A0ABQ1QAU3_9BACI|nr:hypothetical protein GCM10011389_30370 [Pontibacillus salipaludis]